MLCSPDKLTDRRQGGNRGEDKNIPRIDFSQIRLPKMLKEGGMMS